MNEAVAKLQRIFEVAPWLKDSKNAVHLPVNDPAVTNSPKSLPQVTWKELHDELMVAPSRAELLEMLDNVSATASNMMAAHKAHVLDDSTRRKIIDEACAVCDRELRPEDK